MIRAGQATADRFDQLALTTEHVRCLVCGQDSRRRLYSEQYELGNDSARLDINRCRTCGQVYVSPRLDERSTELVYRLDAERTISHAYCWAGRTHDDRFEPLLDRISTLRPAGRLLDVGCGTGNFLAAAAQRHRWQLHGIDPAASAARTAQERTSLPIQQTTLERAQFPSQHFDVISLLGVLEHLHDPAATLKNAARLLKPDGIVAIYVPNFNYLKFKDAGLGSWLRTRKWSALAPQEHLFQFTPRLLKQLLERSGFQIERLDVGRPFMGSGPKRWLKLAAYSATVALFQTTRVHLGGLEAVARLNRVSVTNQLDDRHAA